MSRRDGLFEGGGERVGSAGGGPRRVTTYLLQMALEEAAGNTIVFEVDEPEALAGPERASRWAGRRQLDPEAATETFEQALERVKPAAAALVERLKGLAADEYSIEFGIKFSANAGVVIASASTEAHFTIRLGWHGDGGRSGG